MAEAIPASPQEVYKRSITIEADTVTLAPPPLAYFTMALGF